MASISGSHHLTKFIGFLYGPISSSCRYLTRSTTAQSPVPSARTSGITWGRVVGTRALTCNVKHGKSEFKTLSNRPGICQLSLP